METPQPTMFRAKMRSRAKVLLSWLVALLGFCIGLLLLAVFGKAWLPLNDEGETWFVRWLMFAGVGLAALVFLSGSLIAVRNPRRAGVVFLACIPVTAFCLSYESSGFLVWHADGGGYFETPLPWTAVGLTLLFFLPFVAPLFVWRNKKRAAILFAGAGVPAIVVFAESRWTSVLVPHLAATSAPFLLFGLFWLGTQKLGWPTLSKARQRGVPRRIAAVCLMCGIILLLDVALTLGLAALGSSLFNGDCKGKQPFTGPQSTSQAVFTARVLYAGLSLTTKRDLRWSSTQSLDPHVGEWAIAVVQERFWGLSSWNPRLVLLTNFIYWQGETYFIDGDRQNGLLTRALPIIEAGIGCSRSRPIQDAMIDLRVLHESQPAAGGRLLGYVRKPEPFRGGIERPLGHQAFAGARIRMDGPAGTREITADQQGIYELSGLPEGDYTLQLDLPEGQVSGLWDSDSSPVKVHMNHDGIVERSFTLFWNGRIAGRVTDDAGNPAHVWIMLQNADGSRLPGYADSFSPTKTDGTYEMKRVPPGRYTVVANRNGPSEESSFERQYFPAASRPEDARTLEVGPGQTMTGIDFSVHRPRQ